MDPWPAQDISGTIVYYIRLYSSLKSKTNIKLTGGSFHQNRSWSCSRHAHASLVDGAHSELVFPAFHQPRDFRRRVHDRRVVRLAPSRTRYAPLALLDEVSSDWSATVAIWLSPG